MTTSNEQDHRINILNSLLVTPHRDLASSQPLHAKLIEDDPLFYQQLAAWYNVNGDINDHKQLFVANLLVSTFSGHRDIGLALLREMPPFRLVRIIDFVKSGLKRNLPRSVHTEVARYLKDREADNEWFDTCAITARKQMKRMYALFHIAPSERAQAILFDEQMPEGSKAAQVKALRSANSPTDQARIIMENKIPYRIASTVIDQMTPTVVYALIDVMSDQELINNVSSLQKRGAFNNIDLKNKINARLEKAKSSKKITAMKSMEARKVAKVDDETSKMLADIADTQLKTKGRIKVDTALLIDKSSSMSGAIEVGKRVGSMISSIVDDGVKFYAYAFDTMPYVVTTNGKTLADWESALRGIKANGATTNSAPIVLMNRMGIKVEQIVMITDEGENGNPTFANALVDYSNKMGVKPSVMMLRVYSNRMYKHTKITDELRKKGFDVEDMDIVNTDHYSEPTILQFLCRKSKLELLMEVMTWPLPQRKVS